MARRVELLLITLLLIIAAAMRIADLTRLPPGLSDEEITMTYITEATRAGELPIASFYNVGDPDGGREGLFPFFQSLFGGLFGDGLLPYRAFPFACGLISVALLFALTKRLFGSFAAFVAVTAMAISLWPVLLSRSAIRETLLLPILLGILLTLAAAVHLRRTIRTEHPLTTTYAILGILLVTAGYIHWSGLVLPVLFVAFIVYLVATRQPVSRRIVGYSAFAGLVMLIVGIPYLVFTIRSFQLSGFQHWFAVRPPDIGTFVSDALGTLLSIFVKGDPAAAHNIPGAPLIGPLGTILFLIGLVRAVREWRQAAMMLILLSLGLGLWVDIWSNGGPSFAHSLIALPAVMILIGLGAKTSVEFFRRVVKLPSLSEGIILGSTLAGVFVSILYGVDTLIQRWGPLPEVGTAFNARLGNLAIYLDRVNDTQTTSICTFRLDGTNWTQATSSRIADTLPDSTILSWMLHRKEPDRLRFSNCISGFVLTGGGKLQRVAFVDPGARELLSPAFAKWLSTSKPVFGNPTILELDAQRIVEDTFGQTTMSPAKWAPESNGLSLTPSLPLRMGGYLTFEGYESATAIYKPGDTLTIATYWRADGPQIPGLRLFVHVLRSPQAAPALQTDMLSIDPTFLQDRDVFIQVHFIPIPPDFPAGEYELSVGAYSTLTNTRLPIYDQNQERGNRLFLDKITVISR